MVAIGYFETVPKMLINQQKVLPYQKSCIELEPASRYNYLYGPYILFFHHLLILVNMVGQQ